MSTPINASANAPRMVARAARGRPNENSASVSVVMRTHYVPPAMAFAFNEPPAEILCVRNGGFDLLIGVFRSSHIYTKGFRDV